MSNEHRADINATKTIPNLTSKLPAYDMAIDITKERCPLTFVKTRRALDSLTSGQLLLVKLKGSEPLSSLPKAVADQGHDPIDLIPQDDGTTLLIIRKA